MSHGSQRSNGGRLIANLSGSLPGVRCLSDKIPASRDYHRSGRSLVWGWPRCCVAPSLNACTFFAANLRRLYSRRSITVFPLVSEFSGLIVGENSVIYQGR